MKHSRKHLTLALSPVIYVHVQVALYSSTALVASWYVQIIFAIHEFIFFKLASGRNPPNSAI